MRDWVSGAKHVANGLEIRANAAGESNLSNLITFYGLGNATSSNRPHLTVVWQPQVGSPAWIGQYTHKLSDRMSLAVDYADRNLVLSNTDDQISSPGQSLSVQRTYNSLDAAAGLSGAFGPGWALNGGTDVSLTWNHAGASLVERDGSIAYFSRNFAQTSLTVRQKDNNSNGPSYNPSPGLNADLTKPSSTQYKVYFRKTHTVWTFTLPTAGTTTGYLSSIDDGNGNTLTYTATGSPLTTTKITDSTGQRSVTPTYTSGVITSMSESLAAGATGARSWSYGYTSAALTSYTDAAGNQTTYCYTSGLLTKIITPRGVAAGGTCSTTNGTDVTDIAYDSCGHVASISYENGADPAITVSFAVGTPLPPGGSGGTTTFTDPYGQVTTYHYDTTDRITRSDSPLGYHRSATYNTNNDVTAAVSANNFTGGASDPATTFGYDESGTGSTSGFGNLTSVTQPSGTKTGGRSYDESGASGTDPYQPASSTDDINSQTSYTYNSAGQVTAATLGGTGGSTVSLIYDSSSASSHCGPGSAAAYTGALCQARDADYSASSPAEHRTLYSYDSLGELTSKTTAQPDHGRSTPPAYTYTYDSHSRLTSETTPAGDLIEYSYDALDRLTEKNAVYQGVYTAYTYDQDGDLTNTGDYYSDGTPYNTGGHDITRSYDNLDRQIQQAQTGYATVDVTWDANSRMATYSDGNGGVTSYSYDADGRLISEALWGGSCAGFNTTTNLPTVASNCITFAIDADGNRTKAYFPGTNVAETWVYNADDKITEVIGTGTISGTNATLVDDTYDYGTGSTAGDHLQTRRDAVNDQRVEYTYDTHSRLSSAKTYNSQISGQGTQTAAGSSYCYDPANNLIDLSTTVGTDCSTSSPGRSFDGANQQLGTNHTYNLAGSETSTVSGLPTTGSVRTTTWSPTQEPLTLSENGGASKNQDFLDFTNNTMIYSDTNNGDSDLLADGPLGIDAYVYYHGGAVQNEYSYARDPQGQPLAMRDLNGQEEFFVTDNQGSVLDLLWQTDGGIVDAYHYSPTGARTIDQNTVPQPLGYLGAETNYSTGLVHLGARFYDPSLLAFTQTDPKTHNSSPAQDNPYAYAGDDPTNNTDVSGELSFSLSGCIGFIVSACGSVSADTSGHFGVGGSVGVGFGGDVSATASPGDVSSGLSAGEAGCFAGYCGGISGSGGGVSPSVGVGGGAGGFLTIGGTYAF